MRPRGPPISVSPALGFQELISMSSVIICLMWVLEAQTWVLMLSRPTLDQQPLLDTLIKQVEELILL